MSREFLISSFHKYQSNSIFDSEDVPAVRAGQLRNFSKIMELYAPEIIHREFVLKIIKESTRDDIVPGEFIICRSFFPLMSVDLNRLLASADSDRSLASNLLKDAFSIGFSASDVRDYDLMKYIKHGKFEAMKKIKENTPPLEEESAEHQEFFNGAVIGIDGCSNVTFGSVVAPGSNKVFRIKNTDSMNVGSVDTSINSKKQLIAFVVQEIRKNSRAESAGKNLIHYINNEDSVGARGAWREFKEIVPFADAMSSLAEKVFAYFSS